MKRMLIIAALAACSPAMAHIAPSGMVYPGECCNSAATSPNGDCAPIDVKYVTERLDGYHVNLPVGAHPQLKTQGYSGVVPYSSARWSEDGQPHICLGYNGVNRFCFFMPPRGS